MWLASLTRRMMFLAVLLAMFTMSVGPLGPAQAITNGEVDSENQLSNVGAIVLIKGHPEFTDFPDLATAPAVACSGILIHPRVLLTAGHCSEPVSSGAVPLEDIRVSLSPNAFDRKSWLEVAQVITHPDYSRSTLDIGVIILKKPVKGVRPAALPPAFLIEELFDGGLLLDEGGGVPLLIAGYGQTATFPPMVFHRPDGKRRFAFSSFHALLSDLLVLSHNIADGEGGSGDHDSGGPAFWIDPNSGELVLVSVLSYVEGNPDMLRAQGWYGRLDIPVTLEFLEDVLTAVDAGLL